MQKATLLRAGGTLLFFVAASPASAQVTTLNADDALNAPPSTTTAQDPDGTNVRPPNDYAANSLIVTGPVDKPEAAPNIDLDKVLSEVSGAPTVKDTGAEKH
jgi:hypothetical protein